MRSSVALLLLLCGSVAAHDMRPTYPSWGISHIANVKHTSIEIFNKRSDVEWYEVGVFDINWKPLPFVTRYKVMQIEYLDNLKVDVYIAEANSIAAEYICSKSKVRANENNTPIVSSRICSRFK